MAKNKAAKPAAKPEPVETEEVEEATGGRGPGALHEAMAEWLDDNYPIEGGHDPYTLYLAQTKRKEFRGSESYASIKTDQEARAAARAKAAEERAAKAEEADEDEDDEPVVKPSKGKKAKAAAVAEKAEEAAPTVAKKGKKAKATAEAAEATPASTGKKGKRQAAF
jgi:hypothetical protein